MICTDYMSSKQRSASVKMGHCVQATNDFFPRNNSLLFYGMDTLYLIILNNYWYTLINSWLLLCQTDFLLFMLLHVPDVVHVCLIIGDFYNVGTVTWLISDD